MNRRPEFGGAPNGADANSDKADPAAAVPIEAKVQHQCVRLQAEEDCTLLVQRFIAKDPQVWHLTHLFGSLLLTFE